MAKFILIHGYGSGANYSIFKKYPEDLEFSGFKKVLDSKDAVFFRWFKVYNFSFLQTLNPWTHVKLYLTEKKDVAKNEIIEELNKTITQEKPEIIICHSMGSLLLKNYLEKNTLPDSVKKIVLVQADIPHNSSFNTSIKITDFFCFWDPSLICSLFINRSIPAGLFGLKSPSRNVFFPLLRLPNIHLASIKSKKLLEKIESS